MARLVASPGDAALAGELVTALKVMAILPFPIDLRMVQSLYHRWLKSPELANRARAGDSAAREGFGQLGELLKVRAAP
ncbi:MAG: hypothetical protein EHM21_17255 [Chloroflexi bacterium]|nr:MAG: hypothetical protein EHM21_17255 [Chloroflexota bacterium]